MKTSRRTLLKNSVATAAALSLDWRFAQRPGRDGAHRRHLRSVRPVRGRRLGRLVDRHANRDRSLQRARRRRRQIQGRPGQRGFAEQGRRRDQRGRAPDQSGKGRHHRRRLFERSRGATGGQDRGAEEDSLDHDRGRDRRVQGQEPAIRVPRADPLRSIWPGLRRLHRRARQGEARRRAEGREGRAHSRGRPLRRRRRRGRRGLFQGGRPQRRPARRIFGGGSRSVVAGDQAQARRRPI